MTPLRSPFEEDFTAADASGLANVLFALAHPARMRIVSLLVQGPMNGRQLEVRLGSDQRFVAHQLAVLEQAGLVDRRRDGMSVVRTLRLDVLRALGQLLNPGGGA